jgi:osmotically-inducible protein OsmY
MSTSTMEQSRAAQALRHSAIPAIRNLSIEETEEFVVIQGSVVSYYLKQLAQETVMSVLEGRELRNRVTVDRTRPEPNP